jgi:hypothetical protein
MRLRKKGNTKWSHARVILTVLSALIVCALLFIGCSSTGACVGTNSDLSFVTDKCKNNFSKDECEEHDADEVNGQDWDWNRGDECEDLGFTVECTSGIFTRPGECS